VRDPLRRDHEDDRLSAFLDDELSEPDALAVTRHLARCDACLTELESLRSTRAALRGLPYIEPPASFLAGIASSAAASGDDGWTRSMRFAAAGLLASAVLGATAFALGGEPDGDVVPPVDLFVVDHVVRTGGGPVITPVDLGR
jgi:anti-sigma factor RsiW